MADLYKPEDLEKKRRELANLLDELERSRTASDEILKLQKRTVAVAEDVRKNLQEGRQLGNVDRLFRLLSATGMTNAQYEAEGTRSVMDMKDPVAMLQRYNKKFSETYNADIIKNLQAAWTGKETYSKRPASGVDLLVKSGWDADKTTTKTLGMLTEMGGDPGMFIKPFATGLKSILPALKRIGAASQAIGKKAPIVEKVVDAIGRRFDKFYDLDKSGYFRAEEFKVEVLKAVSTGNLQGLKQFGQPIRSIKWDKATNAQKAAWSRDAAAMVNLGHNPGPGSLGGYTFNKEINAVLYDTFTKGSRPEPGKILKGIDWIQNTTKSLLPLSGKWITSILTDGTFRNILENALPKDAWKAGKTLWTKAGKSTPEYKALQEGGQLQNTGMLDVKLGKLSWDPRTWFANIANQFDAFSRATLYMTKTRVGNKELAKNMTETFVPAFEKWFSPNRGTLAQTLTQIVETQKNIGPLRKTGSANIIPSWEQAFNPARVQNYEQGFQTIISSAVKKSAPPAVKKTAKDISDEAIKNVNLVQGNYLTAMLTDFERTYMSRMFPYYKFEKSQLLYQPGAIVQGQNKFAGMYYAQKNLESPEQKNNQTPEWMDSWSINGWSGFRTGFEDFAKTLFGGIDNLIQKLNVPVTIFSQAAGDYSNFNKRSISGNREPQGYEHLGPIAKDVVGYNPGRNEIDNPFIRNSLDTFLGAAMRQYKDLRNPDRTWAEALFTVRNYNKAIEKSQFAEGTKDQGTGGVVGQMFSTLKAMYDTMVGNGLFGGKTAQASGKTPTAPNGFTLVPTNQYANLYSRPIAQPATMAGQKTPVQIQEDAVNDLLAKAITVQNKVRSDNRLTWAKDSTRGGAGTTDEQAKILYMKLRQQFGPDAQGTERQRVSEINSLIIALERLATDIENGGGSGDPQADYLHAFKLRRRAADIRQDLNPAPKEIYELQKRAAEIRYDKDRPLPVTVVNEKGEVTPGETRFTDKELSLNYIGKTYKEQAMIRAQQELTRYRAGLAELKESATEKGTQAYIDSWLNTQLVKYKVKLALIGKGQDSKEWMDTVKLLMGEYEDKRKDMFRETNNEISKTISTWADGMADGVEKITLKGQAAVMAFANSKEGYKLYINDQQAFNDRILAMQFETQGKIQVQRASDAKAMSEYLNSIYKEDMQSTITALQQLYDRGGLTIEQFFSKQETIIADQAKKQAILWAKTFVENIRTTKLEISPEIPEPMRTAQATNTLKGRVTQVDDGDTMTITDSSGKMTVVRWGNADAPETEKAPKTDFNTTDKTILAQAMADEAKKYVTEKLLGKDIEVVPSAIDKYGRTVGNVKLDGKNMSQDLIRQGLAYPFIGGGKFTAPDEIPYYMDAMVKAIKDGFGLWSLEAKDRIMPEDWRAVGKGTIPSSAARSADTIFGLDNSKPNWDVNLADPKNILNDGGKTLESYRQKILDGLNKLPAEPDRQKLADMAAKVIAESRLPDFIEKTITSVPTAIQKALLDQINPSRIVEDPALVQAKKLLETSIATLEKDDKLSPKEVGDNLLALYKSFEPLLTSGDANKLNEASAAFHKIMTDLRDKLRELGYTVIDETKKFNAAIAELKTQTAALLSDSARMLSPHEPQFGGIGGALSMVFGRGKELSKGLPQRPWNYDFDKEDQDRRRGNLAQEQAAKYSKDISTYKLGAIPGFNMETYTGNTPEEADAYVKKYEAEIEAIQANNEEKLRLKGDINEQLDGMDNVLIEKKTQRAAQELQFDRETWQKRFDTASAVTGGLLDLTTQLYEASGRKSKELFYMMKAVAIADVIVKGAQAAMNAYAQGGPYAGPALAAIAAAMTGVQIGVIIAQTVSGPEGKAEGGEITGGSGSHDDVPIMAMGGEYIIQKSSVNKYGKGFLEAINSGMFDPGDSVFAMPDIPSPKSNRYADGGPVGNVDVRKEDQKDTGNLQIVNIIDPALVDKYMTTPSGQRTVLNIMAANKYEINKIMSS